MLNGVDEVLSALKQRLFRKVKVGGKGGHQKAGCPLPVESLSSTKNPLRFLVFPSPDLQKSFFRKGRTRYIYIQQQTSELAQHKKKVF